MLFQNVRTDNPGNVYVNLQDGSANSLTSTSGALDVNLKYAQVSIGVVDESTFTYGTSQEQPVGGVYQDTAPTLSAGQTGAVRLTQYRAFHTNLRDSSGVELGNSNASGLFVRPGDGTNHQAYSGTNEAFVQVRQGGNIQSVNSSNEALVKDTAAEASLASIDNKMSSDTATPGTPVVLSTSSQVALASNGSRKGFILVNDSNKTVWITFGATSSPTAYTYKIQPNGTLEPQGNTVYRGVISVIGDTGISGKLYSTEL